MSIRRRTFLDAASKLALAGFASGPLALAAGQAAAQAGSAAAMPVGDFKITPLFDGVVDVDEAIFAGTDDEARRALLAAAGQQEGKIRLDVNAFLIERAGTRILVDAGTRDLYGPTLGKVPEGLAMRGVSPESIDHVLLTHMHNDHVGGLVDPEGVAVFANAELHVSGTEWDYWTSEERFERASEQNRFSFAGARAASGAYSERLRTFSGTREVLPGISAIPLPGHSPAHSGFIVSSGNQQIVIWGDAVVSPELQFANPDWSSTFDADREASVSSRKRIFDQVATDRIPVLGMHLPFPGHGLVERDGLAYRFVDVG
jgi:glyoxylase-like metal-dependent hydrolase (beta-lactamase superfamily II)